MGLLKRIDDGNSDPPPQDAQDKLIACKRNLAKARRNNDALMFQVNNLIYIVSEETRRKRALHQRIVINPKTGLPNHNQMDHDVADFLRKHTSRPEAISGAAVLIKLDNNYDIIMKTLKPSVSEWIIYQISSRLKEIITDKTLLYHSRDDEFILIFPNMGSPDELKPVLDEIESQVAKPHIFSGYHINIFCQMGVSFFPENGINKSSLLNNADIALKFAKKNNKRYVFFSEKMRDDVVQKMELQNSIIKALEEQSIREIDKQFFINMQPIVTVKEFQNGKPRIEQVDAEALIRWKHPEKGIIGPDTFIPIAEETGLIIIIGKWVLYTATAVIEAWSRSTEVESSLAINVSPRQFHNDDLIDSIQRIISFRNIDAEKLQVEITENSFLDNPEDAAKKIKKLKDMGIRIAIDDFGTGFSSVNYLRRLPVDVVKIDRCFVSNITENTQDQSIVRAMIAMSRELGMANVVEGVETVEQLDLLMNLGVNRFQGYYFSKSLSAVDFHDYYTGVRPAAPFNPSERSSGQ